jgi:transcriptional regulator with GAF, ATPase, and Fis domain
MTTTTEFYLDQIQRFKKVFEIQRRSTLESNIEKLATLLMRALSELIEVDRSTLFMFDPELTELRACYPEGVAENTIVVPLQIEEGL